MNASRLGLLSIQSGQTLNPAEQDGATGGGTLDVDQRSCELGAPVPIVFARRRNDKGGILIAPCATEARFENNSVNDVTAYYHLVISEGQVDSIPVKDVFQRSCRLGSHTQTYDRRAGIWIPGNYIIERTGYDKPEASSYCGSVGVYSGMSTLSFQNTVPDGFDQWRKQVHLFIRGGMRVTRLVDSIFGSSDNFADLVLWVLKNSGRMPDALIDQPAFLSAATFLEANGFTCNVEIKDSKNIADFIAGWARYFLLGESNNGGKKGLRPLLPTNANGTIKTSAISAEYTFDESLITQGSFSIEYINYADRLPFVAQVTWRQELGTDAAILRTSEVQFVNTPQAGPFESYDLSQFCTSENHAVKIGAYIVARRALVSHNISFTARPEAHNTTLSPGSIIRVVLSRDNNNEAPSVHDYFYQVERITKTLTGEVGYECSHFPIDSEGRSAIAVYVFNAVGNGVLFTSNQTGVTCDLPGRDTDNTIPDEEFMPDDDIPGWTWDPDTDTWIPDDDIPGWTYDPDTDTWVPDDDIPGWTWDPNEDQWVLDPLEPSPDPEPDPEPDPMPTDPPIDELDPSIDLPLPDSEANSCDGVAAIQFSFEVYKGAKDTVTWYNARLVGNVWRFYFPVGSDNEVFQGLGAGQVRSVRNTGCGGDGSGGQIDGFDDAGGFTSGSGADTGGDGGDATEGNPEDGLDSAGGSSQDTIPGPAPTGTPEPDEILTAPEICSGGVVTWYRLDPSVSGGKVYLTQGPTYTATINDNNFSVYTETICPDPSSPTGYGPTITSPPLLITDGFLPVPNPGATIGWIRTSSFYSGGRYLCSNDSFYDSGLQSSSVSSGSYSNIVSYKQLDEYATYTYLCSGPTTVVTKQLGVLLKRADGSEILVGALKVEGSSSGAGVYGPTRDYEQVELTYLGVAFYTPPAIETPPWP